MNNIEAFNIAVAEIFGRCYKEFPLKVSISNLEIGVAIKDAFGEDPDGYFDLGEVEYQIADAATDWLIKAGYLWCDNPERSISFKGVTLTPKGLEILNSVPEELQSKASLGEKLSKGIKVLGKESALTSVKLGLTYGVKLALGT